MFAAVMFCDMIQGFNMSATVKSVADTILQLRFGRDKRFALVAVLLFAFVPITVINLYFVYAEPDRSSREVAEFLNATTPPAALIETYNMELFVLLNRRYHYPSDEIMLQLIRRSYMLPNLAVDYDPMAADPDYLVVGPDKWHLYDTVLQTGSFRLVLEKSRYKVYERIR
jgi:hypothetical protein